MKVRMLTGRCFAGVLLAMSLPSPYLAASATPIFPKAEWTEATPASQGVDATRLREAVAQLEKIGRDGSRQAIIIRNGRIIWKGPEIDQVHGVWSLTKSVTSTVLGLLVDDGKCSLDTPAATVVPELSATYSKITLRHFTTMTSGYRAKGDEPQGSYLHGPSSTPFQPSPSPLFSPPGSQYAYWDSAMNEFGLVLTRIAGESMESLFRRRIAERIGMDTNSFRWGVMENDNSVPVNGGSGNANKHIFTSARQIARLGLLYLNRGNWNGRQLLSSNWVHQATRLQVAADIPWAHPTSEIDGRGCYGFNWWVNGKTANGKRKLASAPPGTFWASGFNNNTCFVIPEWNMVVVRLGLDGRAPDSAWDAFFAKLSEAVK